jgi:hypothetical protein
MDKPICKDCVHFWIGMRRCMRPVGEVFSVIHGTEAIELNADARRERRGVRTWFSRRTKCGPNALFFKPKRPGVFDTPPPPQRGG